MARSIEKKWLTDLKKIQASDLKFPDHEPVEERYIHLDDITDTPSVYYDLLRYLSEFYFVYAYRGHKMLGDGRTVFSLLSIGYKENNERFLQAATQVIQGIEAEIVKFRLLRKINMVALKYYLMHGNEAASFFKYSLIKESLNNIKKLLEGRGINQYFAVRINNEGRIKLYLEGRSGLRLLYKRLKPGYGESKGNASTI